MEPESAPQPGSPLTVMQVILKSAPYLAAHGVETPRLDAEVLLADLLECTRLQVYLQHDRPLSSGELDTYRERIRRRGAGWPVAMITGRKEFAGRTFLVGADVLCPRPETEHLLEAALEHARLPGADGAGVRILDLCTGSGILGISLALELPGAEVVASDRSGAALNQAAASAELHGVEVDFRQGDLFEVLREDERFDVIVCNPPYLSAEEYEMAGREVRHEPRMALVSEPEATSVLLAVAAAAADRVRPGGAIFLEVGAGQAPVVAGALVDAGFETTRIVCDLAGIERVVIGERAAEEEA